MARRVVALRRPRRARDPRNPGMARNQGTDPLSEFAGLPAARPAFDETRTSRRSSSETGDRRSRWAPQVATSRSLGYAGRETCFAMWALLSSDADDTLKTAVTIPSQEAIEQCATKFGVPVDARIQRGRTTALVRSGRPSSKSALAGSWSRPRRRAPRDRRRRCRVAVSHAAGEIVVLRPSKEGQHGSQTQGFPSGVRQGRTTGLPVRSRRIASTRSINAAEAVRTMATIVTAARTARLGPTAPDAPRG